MSNLTILDTGRATMRDPRAASTAGGMTDRKGVDVKKGSAKPVDVVDKFIAPLLKNGTLADRVAALNEIRRRIHDLRPSDGERVDVWVTKHTRRSHDRQLDGTTYFRPLLTIAGALYDHMPQRHDTPEATLGYIRRQFGLQ